MDLKTFAIDGKAVGGGHPPYLIAEIGINHGGEIDRARTLIDRAAESGADAVKFQYFDPAAFLARSSPYFDIFEKVALSEGDMKRLTEHAAALGVTLFSSVFDEKSADFLAAQASPAFKIASGDLTHLPLIVYLARFGKPLLISTGGATLADIEDAIDAVRGAAPETPLALFQCVSNYPANARDVNLAVMASLRAAFGVPVGFSDHTLGEAAAIAAAALGADLIEKHFTLDRSLPGPDHALSADPAGFRRLADGVRQAFEAVGSAHKRPVEAPEAVKAMRRGLTASRSIAPGEKFTADMLTSKRPAIGLPPVMRDRLIGAVAARAIAADEPIQWAAVDFSGKTGDR